jgi:hypothetical protein
MNADSFHRLAKVLADSGEAKTIEDAHAALASYGVRILLNQMFEDDMAAQITALTAINCSSRSFMGNVIIDAPSDFVLTVPGFAGSRLSEFAEWAGVHTELHGQTHSWPVIEIGASDKTQSEESIRPWSVGWVFGVNGESKQGGPLVAPACVAAGALAVSEAFSILRGDNPYAGCRSLAMSLWDPRKSGSAADIGPLVSMEIPSAWLIGLGHLGQAYAWTIGFMNPKRDATLFLQDIDEITGSTISTSVLSTPSHITHQKTRVVATWLEARGYKTALVERRFDQFQRVGTSEPRIALFGVDNPSARRVFEGAGFSHVIDAGLGSGYRDFKAIRVRTFPGPSRAADLWANNIDAPDIVNASAYKTLLASGADPCGVTLLATRSVGAPFVGCVSAGYVIAAMMRHQLGLESFAFVDLNLRSPAACDALLA